MTDSFKTIRLHADRNFCDARINSDSKSWVLKIGTPFKTRKRVKLFFSFFEKKRPVLLDRCPNNKKTRGADVYLNLPLSQTIWLVKCFLLWGMHNVFPLKSNLSFEHSEFFKRLRLTNRSKLIVACWLKTQQDCHFPGNSRHCVQVLHIFGSFRV